MGLRFLVFACRSACLGVVGLWLLVSPHLRLQMTAAQQFQQFQQFQHQVSATPDQSPWMTSYWDLGQNIKIDQLNEHLAKGTDANISKLQDENLQLSRELSDVEARSSVWFSILGAGVMGALSVAITNFLKLRGKP